MKTYFMSWESSKKRGHSIFDFDDEAEPREVIKIMVASVVDQFPEIEDQVTAVQFNRVD